MPASVTDAVLARVGRLSAECRAALEELSVVPSPVPVGPQHLALAEAEEAGVIVAGPHGLQFRHEIARRAVEQRPAGVEAAGVQRGRRAVLCGRRRTPTWRG